jgi:1,4-dihydroxy-2-naphthoyl-CoA hydrolase
MRPEDSATPSLAGGIHETLGIEFLEVGPDRVVATMPVTPRHWQPFGLLHGGASVVLAESAASLGTWLHCDPATERAVGIEINANHVRAKREGTLRAEAIPLHRGRRTMVWDIRVRDEQDRLVCVARCTVARVAAEDGPRQSTMGRPDTASTAR